MLRGGENDSGSDNGADPSLYLDRINYLKYDLWVLLLTSPSSSESSENSPETSYFKSYSNSIGNKSVNLVLIGRHTLKLN